MGLQVFKDNAGSTLQTGIGSGDSTLDVATGTGSLFPTPTNGRYAYVTIGTSTTRELCSYTGRSGDTLTGLTRGLGITSAVAHLAGVPVQHRMCAEMLTDLQSLIFANTGWFGSGRDGDVTITTTVTLSRNMYYRNLTISGAGILKTNGWRVHVREKTDLSGASAAAIQNLVTTAATAGSVFFGGTGGQGAAAGSFASTGIGGNGEGGSSGANNTPGSIGTAAAAFNPGNGGSTAKGGAGGDSGTLTGGGQPSVSTNTPHIVDHITEDVCIKKVSGGTNFSQINAAAGGSSGASGAGDAGPNYGGGGGGGGGGGAYIWFASKIIDFGSNTTAGLFTVAGGAGGNGANGGGGTAGGGGGGAGGGGGVAYIIVGLVLGSGAQALDLSGGPGGNGGNGVSTGKGGGGGGASGSGVGIVFNFSTSQTSFTDSIAPVHGDLQSSTATGTAGKTNLSFMDIS